MNKIYYCISNNGFYEEDLNMSIPKDVVEISAEYREELIRKSSEPMTELFYNSKTKLPEVKPVEYTEAQLKQMDIARAKRAVADTDNLAAYASLSSIQGGNMSEEYRLALLSREEALKYLHDNNALLTIKATK